jgi:hypothetical protein
LLLTLLPSAHVLAQAPGVPIESGADISFDKQVLEKARALQEAGRLLEQSEVATLAKSPQTTQIDLPAPSKRAIRARDIYRRARAAFLRIGYLCQPSDKEPWALLLGNGYAIADGGVVATAAHVLEPVPEVKKAYLVAITADGHALPVTSILAVDEKIDTGIVRVEGFKGRPLALNVNVSPGDTVYCFSEPLAIRGYFSTGIVNRFSWLEADRGDLKTLSGIGKLRVDVTATWAPGSSGAAVLDRAGNVIGHVESIEDIADIELSEELEASLPQDTSGPPVDKGGHREGQAAKHGEDAEKDPKREREQDELASSATTLFRLHRAIPARGVRLLIQETAKLAQQQVVDVVEADPDKPQLEADAPNIKVGDTAPR